MNVRYFLNKMNTTSNCIVYIYDCDARKEYRIQRPDIRAGFFGQFNDMRVNSFTVRDNTLTLYVERNFNYV